MLQTKGCESPVPFSTTYVAWGLAQDVTLNEAGDLLILARPGFPAVRMDAAGPQAALARRLATGLAATMALHAALDMLAGLGLVTPRLMVDGAVAAELLVNAPAPFTFAAPPRIAPPLHPMLTLRQADDGLAVAIPGRSGQLRLRTPDMIAAVGEMVCRPGMPIAEQSASIRLLARMLQAIGAFDDGEREAGWDPVDLEFHFRTRRGDLATGFGPVAVPVTDSPPPCPALGAPIALPRPDLDRLMRDDVPLAAAMEQRSANAPTRETALQFGQFSDLLYRSMRARPGARGHGRRPYPSGGRCYELDLYVIVAAVEQVPPGMYRYDPDGHALQPVLSGTMNARDALVGEARATMRPPAAPAAIALLAADFGRVQRRYRGMTYALVLKHVGVVMQTLALAGAACGLVIRPLGGGQARNFALATGLDPLAMGSVGEIAVFAAAT